MRHRARMSVCFAAAVLLAASLASTHLLAAEPVRLIFDTDIGNDVDDVLALGVIHALQSRGQCQLLAVTITKDNPLAAEFVDAVNTFYGRGDIPVGIVHDGVDERRGKVPETRPPGRRPSTPLSARSAGRQGPRRREAAPPDPASSARSIGGYRAGRFLHQPGSTTRHAARRHL